MEASHSPTVSTEIVRFQFFPVSSHETCSFIRVAGVHGMLQLVCPKHLIEINHPISQGQLLAILAPVLNSSSFNTSFGYFYIPNYSHLIGIMIINHWVKRGTQHFQTHPNGNFIGFNPYPICMYIYIYKFWLFLYIAIFVGIFCRWPLSQGELPQHRAESRAQKPGFGACGANGLAEGRFQWRRGLRGNGG